MLNKNVSCYTIPNATTIYHSFVKSTDSPAQCQPTCSTETTSFLNKTEVLTLLKPLPQTVSREGATPEDSAKLLVTAKIFQRAAEDMRKMVLI